MSEVVNRKAGRSQTPTKVRPSEPSPVHEPAAPAVETTTQQETNVRRSKTSNAQPNLDLQAQAKVWHFTGTFSFWDNLGTWKTLVYVLIAWSLYESFGQKAVSYAKGFTDVGMTFLYRFIIVGALTLFGLNWKNDVCKDKTVSEWYWGSFRRSSPFLANVFEGGVVMAASKISLQLYNHLWVKKLALNEFTLNWDDLKIMVIVSAFYVTPILSVFYKWINENWTHGGKWGNALFQQLVFSPVFTIFLLIFIDWTTNLVNGKDLWNGDIWNLVKDKFWFLNTWPVTNDEWKVSVFPYLSRQAINFVFWFPQAAIANFYVPAEYTLLFATLSNFVWNIIFDIFIRV